MFPFYQHIESIEWAMTTHESHYDHHDSSWFPSFASQIDDGYSHVKIFLEKSTISWSLPLFPSISERNCLQEQCSQ